MENSRSIHQLCLCLTIFFFFFFKKAASHATLSKFEKRIAPPTFLHWRQCFTVPLYACMKQIFLTKEDIQLHTPIAHPKAIFYRNYKKFEEKSFLHDIQNKNFSVSSIDLNVNYKSITENFLEAIDKHAPLKKNS